MQPRGQVLHLAQVPTAAKPKPHACLAFLIQVNMRAIPVRCLALDNVAAAFVAASGEETSKAKHEARTEDGKAAANKINKVTIPAAQQWFADARTAQLSARRRPPR